MLEEKKMHQQFARLMKLPFAPTSKEDAGILLAEYARIAQGNAQSLAHFIRAVDHLVDTSACVPAPAALKEAILETPVPEREKAPLGCDICEGTGWQRYQRRVSPPGVEPYIADFADHCICELGRWRKAREAERKAEKAAKAAK